MERYLDKIFTAFTKQTVTYSEGWDFDIYAPEGDTVTKRPVVMFLHGGDGKKEDGISWAQNEWAARGYVGVSPSYKQPAGGGFDEAQQKEAVINVWKLIVFLRKNSVKYGISKTNFFVMGVSAGGITAIHATVSLNNRYDPYFGSPIALAQKMKILASASISGAMNDKYFQFLDEEDPMNHAYNGEEDLLVKYSQAEKTVKAMTDLGIASTLMGFKGADHSIGHGDEIKADLIPKFFELIKPGKNVIK